MSAFYLDKQKSFVPKKVQHVSNRDFKMQMAIGIVVKFKRLIMALLLHFIKGEQCLLVVLGFLNLKRDADISVYTIASLKYARLQKGYGPTVNYLWVLIWPCCYLDMWLLHT